MTTLETEASPLTIVESCMIAPGRTATFRRTGATVLNAGTREAGVFLRADGRIIADVPIRVTAMPSHIAEWIASQALPTWYRKSRSGPLGAMSLIRSCACDYGVCSPCQRGQHSKCVTRELPGYRRQSDEANVVSRDGHAYICSPVWRATGPACRWRCPCTGCAELVERETKLARLIRETPARPAKTAPEDQLALF